MEVLKPTSSIYYLFLNSYLAINGMVPHTASSFSNAATRFSEILVLCVMDCSRWGEYRKSTKVRLAVNEALREGFNY